MPTPSGLAFARPIRSDTACTPLLWLFPKSDKGSQHNALYTALRPVSIRAASMHFLRRSGSLSTEDFRVRAACLTLGCMLCQIPQQIVMGLWFRDWLGHLITSATSATRAQIVVVKGTALLGPLHDGPVGQPLSVTFKAIGASKEPIWQLLVGKAPKQLLLCKRTDCLHGNRWHHKALKQHLYWSYFIILCRPCLGKTCKSKSLGLRPPQSQSTRHLRSASTSHIQPRHSTNFGFLARKSSSQSKVPETRQGL